MLNRTVIEKDRFVDMADHSGLILLRQADVIRDLAEEFACGLALLCENDDASVLKTLYDLTRERSIEICLDEAARHNVTVI